MTNRQYNSRMHAIHRAKERYDIHLDMEDIDRIENRIRNNGNDVFFLEKKTKTRSVWIVRYDGIIFSVIYNNSQSCLSTFMHKWYVKKYFN